MTIRRQYQLPNCTLILEGFGNDLGPANPRDSRPILSDLVNAECNFVGISQKLHGGRFFLENLVKTASNYAQECLSGIHHPQEQQQQDGERVHLRKVPGSALHSLVWEPAPGSEEQPITLELTAVQLFDLVEAVDQFVADTRTLPDFSLKLQPLPRRFRQNDEPLGQRALPATLGIASLALAALGFYFLPVPEVRKPEAQPQGNPTETLPPREEPSPSGTSPAPSGKE